MLCVLKQLPKQKRLISSFKQFKRFASDEGPKRTCLYDFHVENGGKMVDFAGWEMPVQYKDSITESHLNVRSNAGIFDVSHMLQTKISGNDAIEFMESLVVGDIAGLKENHGTLSVFTNERGGIIDDLIINKTKEGYLYVVSNAGCSHKDLPLMQNRAEVIRKEGKDVAVEVICNGLLALQGPAMVKVLQPGLDFHLSELPFMTTTSTTVYGIPGCQVTRCGYTGEDGVEISVPSERAVELCQVLMSSKLADVRLAGLGARDSLRLEAGMCLYGNDLEEDITPGQASLTWLIGKRRKETKGFPGADLILEEIKNKPAKRRVGFLSKGPPARGHTPIYDETGEKEIGTVTSGCPSPSLKQNIAMGYVQSAYFKSGTNVKFLLRKKMVDAVVSKMPFVPSHYYTGK